MNLPDDYSHTTLSEINVTPLVDVMLVLLILVIVTAPILMQAVPVNLPRTAALSPTDPPVLAHLTLDAQGTIYLDRHLVAETALETALRERLVQAPTLTVQIQADATLPYGQLARIMACAQRAGIQRLGFVTLAE
ncbi:Biopolymer transport protein ExbD [Gammaproteobacteria bacterium]